jgi:polyisoprenyl-teichoic acid--peptidoglycan teichoic acid transferase
MTPTPPPPGGASPPPPTPPEPPRRPWSLARRVLLAGVGVVLLSGGATAVLALNELDKVVEALGQNKAVKLSARVLAPTSRGGPETLLLVGDDRRPPPKSNPGGFVLPHSNEMLLVRIDPSKPTISMLSIPRELRVTIHPPGAQPVVNRINAAYTIGGIQLMTETIKHVLGISVNHVFVVTFPKFKRAVNEMGCVYMGVDRRYYHVNEPGGEQFFEINLQPGYQRMCGRQALEFVANRHEDTSLTRDARDQRFLLEAKAQYGASLFENREKFERILGRAVETDLHGSGSVLDLLALLVQSQGKPVRRVPFQANLLPAYDTATPRQIHESVRSFLGGTAPIPKYRVGQSLRSVHSHASGRAALPTLAPTDSGALSHARSAAPSLPFALQYPRFRHPYAAAAADTLRRYDIRDPQGHLHPSYAIVVNSAPLGEFYDVQGTSWSEPPLLANPSEAMRAGSRTYELFYEGEQVRTIGWREGGAAYWIENTLTNGLSPREMLAIAEQTVPVVSAIQTRPGGNLSLRDVNLPSRPAPATSAATTVGAVLGFFGLAALCLLALRVLSRGRELGALREQVTRAITLEAHQRSLLVAAGPPAPVTAPSARTVYRVRARWRKRGVAVGMAGVAAALIGAGAYLLLSGGSSSAPPVRGAVPVAVFNATSSAAEAHSIAATLRASHVHVARIGDIKNANLGHGAYVLYPPGTEHQARALARLIPSLTPTVTPIQPQLQSTVGRHGEIVIVLD